MSEEELDTPKEVIIMMGPAYSGKLTRYKEFLEKFPGFKYHLEAGKIFRALTKLSESPKGSQNARAMSIAPFVKAGKPVPDAHTIPLFVEQFSALVKSSSVRKVVIDGFGTRSLAQARHCVGFLKSRGWDVNVVILNTPREVCEERNRAKYEDRQDRIDADCGSAKIAADFEIFHPVKGVFMSLLGEGHVINLPGQEITEDVSRFTRWYEKKSLAVLV